MWVERSIDGREFLATFDLIFTKNFYWFLSATYFWHFPNHLSIDYCHSIWHFRKFADCTFKCQNCWVLLRASMPAVDKCKHWLKRSVLCVYCSARSDTYPRRGVRVLKREYLTWRHPVMYITCLLYTTSGVLLIAALMRGIALTLALYFFF